MRAPRSAAEIREANVRYHDIAAGAYDHKWGIDFGAKGRRQVLEKVRKALGGLPAEPFAHSLEVGAGTGYFSLNLLRAGVVSQATCCDLSPGMLAALRDNSRRLGLPISTAACDAEHLPFEDGSFDLVLGHAVLHHLPDLDGAFAEFRRVLRPGGMLLFAGEPSRHGDVLAAVPKRAADRLAPLWRRAMGAGPASHLQANGNGGVPADDHALEHVVDVHAFSPRELSELAEKSGFGSVRVCGEELLASWFGWANRALEATADPDDVPWLWRQYAYRGYLALKQLDRLLLEGRLPAAAFYNLMLSARRP